MLESLIATSNAPWYKSVCHARHDIFSRQPKRKLELLNRAVQTHARLTREAATGKGIDRHLLGLRLLMRPEDGEAANLFSDEVFDRSATWKLSTSGLSAGHQFRGTGFGAMYPDGYGINCKWNFSHIRCETGRASDADGIYFCLFFFLPSRCFFLDLAGPDLIKFGIESKKTCEETSTEGFINAIALALHDMRDICVGGSDFPQATARL
jgi:carnitine O-acetyltransferase